MIIIIMIIIMIIVMIIVMTMITIVTLLQADNVPEIKDDQLRNPFTEIMLLSGHANIVHLLMVIDERRYTNP
jgi:heme/copper-type cytochrome/quinol oxidase subunit 2